MKTLNKKLVYIITTVFALFSAIVVVPLISGQSQNAVAYDANDPQQVYDAAKNNSAELQKLSAGLEGVESELAQVILQVNTLEQVEIPAANAAYQTATAELERTTKEAEKLGKRLDAAEKDKKRVEGMLETATKEVDAGRVAMAALAREELRGSDQLSSVALVLDADNSEDFVGKVEANETAQRTQTRLLNNAAYTKSSSMNKSERLTAVNDLISDLKAQADENKKLAEKAKIDADEWKKRVDKLEKELVSSKANLEGRQGELQAQKAQAEATAKQIADDIAKIAASGHDFDGSGGFLSWPTDYHRITAPFGYDPSHPYNANHTGTDFGAPCGAPIYAAASGKVIYANVSYGEGGALRVGIDHGESAGVSWISRYYHLSSFNTSTGAWVNRGDVVGYTGSTGWSTGCHLHFETWRNGKPVNPMGVL